MPEPRRVSKIPAERTSDGLHGPCSSQEAHLLDQAIHGLERAEPQFSARIVTTRAQRVAVLAIGAAVVASAALAPGYTSLGLVGILGCWFVANGCFRAWLVWLGADTVSQPVATLQLDDELPRYSILVPLYHEANVVPQLLQALTALDYPRDRLDIKIILEVDDVDTIAAAQVIACDERFHLIRVPVAEPRTKPKACNYALPFVRGEFTVIYDAEDRPEADQLRKAVAAFRDAPNEVACLQARLNFFNAEECWLTNGLMAQTPRAVCQKCSGKPSP